MNRVFVDFENVPSVDLSLIREGVAEITLLIGAKQRRLDLEFVRQIHEHASQVSLIEVGASGRNALDMVLAWHLGRTAEQFPKDSYFVVSHDKDFEPLLAHLHTRGIAVERVDSFAALPFLSGSKAAARSKPVEAQGGRARLPRTRRPARVSTPSAAAVAAAPIDDRLALVIDRLQHRTKARPVRRKTLLSHLNGFYGNRLVPEELDAIVATLEQRGVIAIDRTGRVTYPTAS